MTSRFFVRRGVLNRVTTHTIQCFCVKNTHIRRPKLRPHLKSEVSSVFKTTHVYISKRIRFYFLCKRVDLYAFVCLEQALPHTERSVRVKNTHIRNPKHTHASNNRHYCVINGIRRVRLQHHRLEKLLLSQHRVRIREF